ncbi:Tigger transposable element-derived protein 1-like 216 [Homarus americanus]|uniref:Tigger transposable element-derived protein 1-like 216 n=1 Tax=Homarus americanus TaxID=6706 RepID=A0A8J5MTG6_HOMAM|nr:Tigger transposable element-derived protein 1-like 216 [Homarus americanus]
MKVKTGVCNEHMAINKPELLVKECQDAATVKEVAVNDLRYMATENTNVQVQRVDAGTHGHQMMRVYNSDFTELCIVELAMVKMEKAINIWTEDFNRHHIPLSQKFIHDKAKVLYDRFHAGEGDEEEVSECEKGLCLNLKVRSIENGISSGPGDVSPDPSMECNINFSQGLTSLMAQYKNMFQQLKKQQRQLPITKFFKKTSASTSSADQPKALNFSQ